MQGQTNKYQGDERMYDHKKPYIQFLVGHPQLMRPMDHQLYADIEYLFHHKLKIIQIAEIGKRISRVEISSFYKGRLG